MRVGACGIQGREGVLEQLEDKGGGRSQLSGSVPALKFCTANLRGERTGRERPDRPGGMPH